MRSYRDNESKLITMRSVLMKTDNKEQARKMETENGHCAHTEKLRSTDHQRDRKRGPNKVNKTKKRVKRMSGVWKVKGVRISFATQRMLTEEPDLSKGLCKHG